MNILVLCHGNINRSPLCEAVLKDQLVTDPQARIRSAALKPGARPHRATRKMRNAALDRGYILDDHRAHEVTTEDLQWADLIIYMDNGNRRRLKELLDVEGLDTEIQCLAAWADDPKKQERIPDPNFRKGDSPEFQETVDLIIHCSKNLAADRHSL